MIKKMVEEFKAAKKTSQASVINEHEIHTGGPATIPEQVSPKTSKNTTKQDLKPPDLNIQNIVAKNNAYETDEDEFGGVAEEDIPLEVASRLDTTPPDVPVLMEVMEEHYETRGAVNSGTKDLAYETDEDEFGGVARGTYLWRWGADWPLLLQRSLSWWR